MREKCKGRKGMRRGEDVKEGEMKGGRGREQR